MQRSWDKGLNLFFGICSLLGLILTVATLTFTFNKINIKPPDELAQIYQSLLTIYKILGGSVVSLIIIILLQALTYHRHVEKMQQQLGELPMKNEQLTELVNYYIRIYKYISQSLHNICHSYRYIYLILRDAVIELRREKTQITEEECKEISNKFERFMLAFLVNLKEYLDVITEDDCSICIKLVKDDKVKTLFRDPYNYYYRQRSDFSQDGSQFIFKITENYAFKLISDKSCKETFFACDNLRDHREYFNANPDWRNLYNATMVVPIQANLTGEKLKREYYIIGFLCCDNFEGGFENKEIKNLIASAGDLMFSLLHIYDRFVDLAIKKGFKNEALQRYKYWD